LEIQSQCPDCEVTAADFCEEMLAHGKGTEKRYRNAIFNPCLTSSSAISLEWRELDSLKSKRLVIRFLRVLSGSKASHGAARPPRPTISGNPVCSDQSSTMTRMPTLVTFCHAG
jgi:hypothetical protein